jgi:ATP-dependent DNA helicase PIF1
LNLPGKPPNNLQLKVGSPVILLRNLNPPQLCHGTRLVIKKLMKNVIGFIILKGKFRGENILLPRIPILPTDVRLSGQLLIYNNDDLREENRPSTVPPF